MEITSKFNRIDVLQTKVTINISYQTYLNKVFDSRKWQEREPGINPVSMRKYSTNQQVPPKMAIPPEDPTQQKQLHEAHFNYRQVLIAKAIYAMITCRSDISFAVIKLSQYSANLAEAHCKAAHQVVMKYLTLIKR